MYVVLNQCIDSVLADSDTSIFGLEQSANLWFHGTYVAAESTDHPNIPHPHLHGAGVVLWAANHACGPVQARQGLEGDREVVGLRDVLHGGGAGVRLHDGWELERQHEREQFLQYGGTNGAGGGMRKQNVSERIITVLWTWCHLHIMRAAETLCFVCQCCCKTMATKIFFSLLF